MNLAVRRTPKPHVTVKYLEPDFAELFLDSLRGLGPDDSYRGRELARNAAIGELALAAKVAEQLELLASLHRHKATPAALVWRACPGGSTAPAMVGQMGGTDVQV